MALRDRFALGLHLNLTFGAPLGAMPKLAPTGVLPPPERVVGRAVSRAIDDAEIAGEIERQLDRFEAVAGVPPDFIDGHHHVHALPGIRAALVGVLKRRFPAGGPLVRDPADRIAGDPQAQGRGRQGADGGDACLRFPPGWWRRRALPPIAASPAIRPSARSPMPREFDAFLIAPGQRPMIMCHPGLADDELGADDEIAARRPQEQAFLSDRDGLPGLIWHVAGRDAAGFPGRRPA